MDNNDQQQQKSSRCRCVCERKKKKKKEKEGKWGEGEKRERTNSCVSLYTLIVSMALRPIWPCPDLTAVAKKGHCVRMASGGKKESQTFFDYGTTDKCRLGMCISLPSLPLSLAPHTIRILLISHLHTKIELLSFFHSDTLFPLITPLVLVSSGVFQSDALLPPSAHSSFSSN